MLTSRKVHLSSGVQSPILLATSILEMLGTILAVAKCDMPQHVKWLLPEAMSGWFFMPASTGHLPAKVKYKVGRRQGIGEMR